MTGIAKPKPLYTTHVVDNSSNMAGRYTNAASAKRPTTKLEIMFAGGASHMKTGVENIYLAQRTQCLELPPLSTSVFEGVRGRRVNI